MIFFRTILVCGLLAGLSSCVTSKNDSLLIWSGMTLNDPTLVKGSENKKVALGTVTSVLNKEGNASDHAEFLKAINALLETGARRADDPSSAAYLLNIDFKEYVPGGIFGHTPTAVVTIAYEVKDTSTGATAYQKEHTTRRVYGENENRSEAGRKLATSAVGVLLWGFVPKKSEGVARGERTAVANKAVRDNLAKFAEDFLKTH